MFRHNEAFLGGWQEKTLEYMQKKRYDQQIYGLQPLAANRLDALSAQALQRRIERSWQNIERKPLREMQLEQIRSSVLCCIDEEAACLSADEHDLVERALILGGYIRISDVKELDAALALAHRLWANVGMVSSVPYLELDEAVACAAEKAFSAQKHSLIRQRLTAEQDKLQKMLYLSGVMDDRKPQALISSAMSENGITEERARFLSRCYIWAGFHCIDYSGGVLLLHEAIADPGNLLADRRRKTGSQFSEACLCRVSEDTLAQERSVQCALERSIDGLLRQGRQAGETARDLLYLCKQGAPLPVLEEILQSALIILRTADMREALRRMYHSIPKWMECTENVRIH